MAYLMILYKKTESINVVQFISEAAFFKSNPTVIARKLWTFKLNL